MTLLTPNQDIPQERERHVKWHPIEAKKWHYIQQHCLNMAANIRFLKTVPDPYEYKSPKQHRLSVECDGLHHP